MGRNTKFSHKDLFCNITWIYELWAFHLKVEFKCAGSCTENEFCASSFDFEPSVQGKEFFVMGQFCFLLPIVLNVWWRLLRLEMLGFGPNVCG